MTNIIDIATEDNLQYTFYPVANGAVNFKIRAPNDAHVALTSGPTESEPMYEIMIGGWENSKSVIRKNRAKPDKVEVETPGIMNGGEFRGFWIHWDAGLISAGREGEAVPFISWQDPEPFHIGYFGVCTGWGATGTWKIEDGEEFTTSDKLCYNFLPVLAGSLPIEYNGPHNCHIALTKGPSETEPMYELMIGGWENTKSVIRYNRQQPDKIVVPTPGIVNDGEYRKFIVEWRYGRISVRAGTGTGPLIMQWTDDRPFPITHFGVRTGWGARGHWRIPKLPGVQPSMGAPPASAPYVSGGSAVWVDARGGEVPPSAVVGGQDNGPVYVARAHHEGALIPGKLVAAHGVAYVPWGGAEHGKQEYQVLCGSNVNWVPTSGANIPGGALPGGETEEGEPLFVGRVQHEGTLTTGKVQATHGVCYIPFGGQELGFPDYEVLVGS